MAFHEITLIGLYYLTEKEILCEYCLIILITFLKIKLLSQLGPIVAVS